MSYTFESLSSTIIKVTQSGNEILYKKVYCTTSVNGDYFIFMAHDFETGKLQQQYQLLYTDSTNPIAASAVALKVAVDLLINSYAGGGGGLTLTETEIDFGSLPVQGKKFTITQAGVLPASLVSVSPSGNVATGRVGDDYEWDSINFSAKPNTGTFTLTAYASGRIRGKRKILYSWQ
jgi:hypothetical protein